MVNGNLEKGLSQYIVFGLFNIGMTALADTSSYLSGESTTDLSDFSPNVQ